MGTPLPKVVKTKIPNKLITAVTLNTADQLPVSSSIYPARYTPTNPKRLKRLFEKNSPAKNKVIAKNSHIKKVVIGRNSPTKKIEEVIGRNSPTKK